MEKIWLQHYEPGVPATIDYPDASSMIHSFNQHKITVLMLLSPLWAKN